MDLFAIFPDGVSPLRIIEFLDNSSFDELAELDFIHDRHRNIYHVEGKYFVPLIDCSFHEIRRFATENMTHPDDKAAYAALMEPETLERRLAEASPIPGILREKVRFKLLEGGWRWTEQILVGGEQFGLARGVVRMYIFDIQNQKDRREGRGATYPKSGVRDELTGLRWDKEFFAQTCDLVDIHPDWCLIAIDIENFRLFNDWYGREEGDELLAKIGGLLRRAEQDSGGLAGYLGQDDFCLFAPYDKARVRRLYEEIKALTAKPGGASCVGFLPALGVAPAEEGVKILDLFDRASLAVRKIKGDFHTRIRLYQPSMQEKTEEEYRILSDFQAGLQSGEVYFCLQPQCRVSSGRIVGAESLARWRKADGTRVPPDSFVPVLEKYGFVTDLDQFIWESVCKWLQKWIAAGHTPIPISVNVSQVDIFTIDVPQYFDGLTRKYNLPKYCLKIEITESAYVSDVDAVKEAVRRLRDMGFLVLMDDFGSGYSSLNMLRRLNVDIIKIDAQFLRFNEADSEKGIHILETVLNMTQTMALPVIVEGVETEQQASFLANLGCRYIQGYHFYKPMELSDFESLISDGKKIDTHGFVFKPNQQFHIREFLDQNIYTDSMLNNILGAAAFYEWDGKDNVDIVRFNEQFYRLVNEPNFKNRIAGIQNFFHPNDREKFFSLLRKAEADRMNGAADLFGVYRENGNLGTFLIHLYYLERTDKGAIFYGAMQEVTEVTDLQNQMRLLSRFCSESIVFLRRRNGQWLSQIVVHGLEDAIGLSKEEFRRELDEGGFYRRFDDTAREILYAMLEASEEDELNFGFPARILNAKGDMEQLYVKIDFVHDEYSEVERILMFRKREEQDTSAPRL
ncbi:MAG: EAL domain-containing protein [Oscillibacter sp.]|nr:EAL domain-containing protein [Oscillibacter sp.]